jgi:flavin reductase (DIM6/NTAB) family NADH-FMN oxidoreductase RutF
MRKLWNRPAWPVWSVSTIDQEGQGNMNIATYVQAVSLDPKLMTIAVYKDTKTLNNIQLSKRCLLQLLPESLAPVVRVCGQKSGNDIDKIARLQKRFELKQHTDLYYFADAAGWLELEIADMHDVGGDHILVTGKVVKQKNLHDVQILTTDYLRTNGYIR